MYGERLRLNPLVCFVSWYLIFIADFCLLMLLVIQDTIHTVYYAWAMLQVPPEELGAKGFWQCKSELMKLPSCLRK